MSEKKLRGVDILGRDNIHRWKAQVLSALAQKDLDKWITELPDATVPAELHSDKMCRGLLFLSVDQDWQDKLMLKEEEVRRGIRPIWYARTVWEYISSTAIAELVPHTLTFQREWDNLRQGDSQSVKEYMDDVDRLRKKLADVRQPVSMESVVTKVIQGLSHEYDSLRDHLIVAGPIFTDLPMLRQRLEAVEASKIDMKKNSRTVGGFSARGGRGSGGNSQRPPQRDATRDTPRDGSFSGDCHYCGQKGHRWTDCKLRTQALPAQPCTFAEGYPRSGVSAPSPLSVPDSSAQCAQSALSLKSDKLEWKLCKRAATHLCAQRDRFEDYVDYVQPTRLATGNGASVASYGCGKVGINHIAFHDVAYTPDATMNVISTKVLKSEGWKVELRDGRMLVRCPYPMCELVGHFRDGCWILQTDPTQFTAFHARDTRVASHADMTAAVDMHKQYGHARMTTLAHMLESGAVQHPTLTPEILKQAATAQVCGTCASVRPDPECAQPDVCTPFCTLHVDFAPRAQEHSTETRVVYCVMTHGSAQYGFAHAVSTASEAADFVLSTTRVIKRQHGAPVQRFRIDRGYSELSSLLLPVVHSEGAVLEHGSAFPCSVATDFANDVMHRVVVQLKESGLTGAFMSECLAYTVFTWNLQSEVGERCTRSELFFHAAPTTVSLHAFGTPVWCRVPDAKRAKLDPKAIRGLLVGYEPPLGSRAYRVLIGGEIHVSCDVRFTPEPTVVSPIVSLDTGTDSGEVGDSPARPEPSVPSTPPPSQPSSVAPPATPGVPANDVFMDDDEDDVTEYAEPSPSTDEQSEPDMTDDGVMQPEVSSTAPLSNSEVGSPTVEETPSPSSDSPIPDSPIASRTRWRSSRATLSMLGKAIGGALGKRLSRPASNSNAVVSHETGTTPKVRRLFLRRSSTAY